MIVRNTSFNILNFVGFKQIGNWSVNHILGQRIGYNRKYSSRPIGSFVKRSSTTINVQNDKQYKQVTLKTKGGGAVLRDIKNGKDIGTKKQFVVSEGQFIMSKIDARNGAFGVVPKELDGAIVTADFPVFDVEADIINPEYFALISSTNVFARFAQSCSRGTTNRQRIDINLFLSQQIPTPTLNEQQALVNAYKEKIQLSQELERQASQKEKEIEEYLLSELNISITKAKLHKGLNLIRFKDVERWDIPFFVSNTKASSKYDTVNLATCLDKFMLDNKGQSLRTETYKNPTNTYHYIGMDSIEKSSGTLLDLPIVKGSDIKSQTISVPIRYFIYGKLRPYLNKYWINDRNETDIVCSSEFFVFSIKDSINKLFFKYLLSSSLVQSQLSDAVSGARMPRINESIFKNLLLPIPPRSIQDRIAEHINEQKEQMKQMKQQAEELRKKALEEFEKKIFE